MSKFTISPVVRACDERAGVGPPAAAANTLVGVPAVEMPEPVRHE